MDFKQCRMCSISKTLDNFYVGNATCKPCKKSKINVNNRNITRRLFYQNNKKKILDACRKYNQKNRELVNLRKKNYWASRPERVKFLRKRVKSNPLFKINRNTQLRLKRQENIQFRLMENLRSRLYKATKGLIKAGSAVKDLGCSITEFRSYLESQFKNGMTWENYGEFWAVDHIVPISRFDLTNREQILKVNHYTNLQPLTNFENQSKGNKVS